MLLGLAAGRLPPGRLAGRTDARQVGDLLARTFPVWPGGRSAAQLTRPARGGCVLALYLDEGEIDAPGTLERTADVRLELGSLFGMPAVVELCPGPALVRGRPAGVRGQAVPEVNANRPGIPGR